MAGLENNCFDCLRGEVWGQWRDGKSDFLEKDDTEDDTEDDSEDGSEDASEDCYSNLYLMLFVVVLLNYPVCVYSSEII